MAVALGAIHLLSSSAAESQENETLLLPEDQRAVDDIIVRGTRTTAAMWGVSRMTVPGSDTAYYVMDQVTAYRGRIADQLANVQLNDSDVSIHYGPLQDEFVHLRVDGESPELAYFRFEGSLVGQLTEFFLGGGFSSGSGSVDYEAYQLRLGDCAGLEAAAAELRAALRELTGSLGSVHACRTAFEPELRAIEF